MADSREGKERIPQEPAAEGTADSAELSAKELEGVAGGTFTVEGVTQSVLNQAVGEVQGDLTSIAGKIATTNQTKQDQRQAISDLR
jgi:hypothetical protein